MVGPEGGVGFNPREGQLGHLSEPHHRANGKVSSHNMRLRDVWRVYDIGIGVDWMRSHPPMILCNSVTAASHSLCIMPGIPASSARLSALDAAAAMHMG